MSEITVIGQNAVDPPDQPEADNNLSGAVGAGGVRVEVDVFGGHQGRNQGEGYIEGVYTEYTTQALDMHSFAYSRLRC